MFGYVVASYKELDLEAQGRYGAVYCGICRAIRDRSGNLARLGLTYDMAFLAILLGSLYEPEETSGKNGCIVHPLTRKDWVQHRFVEYAADMNVALDYYNLRDDWEDDGNIGAKALAGALEGNLGRIREDYPRQCQAMEDCIRRLSQLEKDGCDNPDLTAAAFGELMGEVLVYREDLWAADLREMGRYLGRYIYLLDAALDYDKDLKKGRYNPYIAMGSGRDWGRWEEYLLMTMGSCTECFERLPLVQDKGILDNILYSGVWVNYRRRRNEKV